MNPRKCSLPIQPAFCNLKSAIICLIIFVVGCRSPIQTQSQIELKKPIEGHIQAQVSGEMTMKPDPGPLQEFSPGGVCADGAKVAVLDLDGLLANTNLVGVFSAGENPVALFQEKLQKAAGDPSVVALVLRINSPGGGVGAIDLMWRELMDFRQSTGKPIVACVLDVGTSGAYYLASAADTIMASPNSLTGGVGVITNLYNLEDAMTNFNIFASSIKAGKHIDMGTPTRPIEDAERTMFQSLAQEYHKRFQEIILARRPQLQNQKNVFDGRVMSAKQALDVKLIDHIGYISDAVKSAAQMANVPSAHAVMYSRKNQPMRSLYATMANQPGGGLFPLDVPGLSRRHLPMFLYLWLPEPGLAKTGP